MTIFHSNPGLFGVSWCAWCGQSFRSSLDDCPSCGRTRRWSQRVDGNTKKLAAVKRNRKGWTVERTARFIDDLTEAMEDLSLESPLKLAAVRRTARFIDDLTEAMEDLSLESPLKLAAVRRNRKLIDDLTEAIECLSLDIVLGVARVFEADGTRSLYITGAEVGEALRMAVKQYQKDRAVSRSHGV